MKKFNKKLTLNLPDDTINTNQNQSSLIGHDSNNRYLEFKDEQNSDNGESQKHQVKTFVEFEEFNVQNQDNREINKKKFNIDAIVKEARKWKDNFRGQKLQLQQQLKQEDDKFKQPPAPSKASTKNKMFIFPTTPPRKSVQKEQNITEIKQLFERERQQFYKEKSKLQREILIKNGQIDMLQKIVKEKYQHKPKQYQSQQLQTILLEKDLQINQLLEKINHLSENLSKKTQLLSKQLLQTSTLQSLIESLRNQLYIYEKKQASDKMTKRFFQLKQQRGMEVDYEYPSNLGSQFGMKGLEDLQKRIQLVKMNRIQFNNRNKIKSDISYSQTTKNKNKISFDFKAKAYDKKHNLNQTRMY